ncbi:hypothetical protein D3C76_1856840 [compost metagenome]
MNEAGIGNRNSRLIYAAVDTIDKGRSVSVLGIVFQPGMSWVVMHNVFSLNNFHGRPSLFIFS